MLTFCGTLGQKRCIDYCIFSNDLMKVDGKAIDDLHLNSDHRTVQVCIQLPTRAMRHRRRRNINWTEFENCMRTNGIDDAPDLPTLETKLAECGRQCYTSPENSIKKPRESEELLELRRLRRNCCFA